jgi:hypothetical protein
VAPQVHLPVEELFLEELFQEVEVLTNEQEEEYLPSPERPVTNVTQGRTHTAGTSALSQYQTAVQGRTHTAGTSSLSQQKASAQERTNTAGTSALSLQKAAVQGRTHTAGTTSLSQQQAAALGRAHTAGTRSVSQQQAGLLGPMNTSSLSQQQGAAQVRTISASTCGLSQQQAGLQGPINTLSLSQRQAAVQGHMHRQTGGLPQQQAGSSSAPPRRDDHTYQAAGNNKSRASKTPSKHRPPAVSSSVPGDDAYSDVMKERKRRLETKMTNEVKKKEAEYWHLKKMKLLSTISGEPVNTSQITTTLGPLLEDKLLDEVDLDIPRFDESDERNVILFALNCRSRPKFFFTSDLDQTKGYGSFQIRIWSQIHTQTAKLSVDFLFIKFLNFLFNNKIRTQLVRNIKFSVVDP